MRQNSRWSVDSCHFKSGLAISTFLLIWMNRALYHRRVFSALSSKKNSLTFNNSLRFFCSLSFLLKNYSRLTSIICCSSSKWEIHSRTNKSEISKRWFESIRQLLSVNSIQCLPILQHHGTHTHTERDVLIYCTRINKSNWWRKKKQYCYFHINIIIIIKITLNN